MTTDDLVLLDRPRPDVAVVTLNRPDRLNALSFALVDQLHATLDEVQRDNEVRVAILNVISGAAFMFSSVVSMYGTGKAGLLAHTRAAAAELAPFGIRVNALSPGTVNTDMVRANTEEKQQVMAEVMLLKRMAQPDEMVGPALLLTSDAGSFITGQVLLADGGMVPH